MSPRRGRIEAPKIDVPVPNQYRRWKVGSDDSAALGTQLTDAAYRRGYHAARWENSLSEYQNPYLPPPYSDGAQWEAWEAGWKDGRRRLEEDMLNAG